MKSHIFELDHIVSRLPKEWSGGRREILSMFDHETNENVSPRPLCPALRFPFCRLVQTINCSYFLLSPPPTPLAHFFCGTLLSDVDVGVETKPKTVSLFNNGLCEI